MRLKIASAIIGISFLFCVAQAERIAEHRQDITTSVKSSQLSADNATRKGVDRGRNVADSAITDATAPIENNNAPARPNAKLDYTSKQIEASDVSIDAFQDNKAYKIEATVINPFRIAAVAAEVGGLIDNFYFEPGDLVQKGETIVEISKKRYDLIVRKAQENVEALRNALDRAKKDKEIKEKLVEMDAASEQELMRAEAEVEISEHRMKEAEFALEQAFLDLQSCQVKSPFTGYLAIRHKEPYEAVGPLEKLFTLVDSAKVYAVAYVPENMIRDFDKGKEAAFNHSSGKQYLGRVERIDPIIDPKTDTQKVYVLIDNSQGRLGVGMSGSLEAVK